LWFEQFATSFEDPTFDREAAGAEARHELGTRVEDGIVVTSIRNFYV